jgi:hypothetical protein
MRTDNQRGFALPAAIGALVIIGILVTAGFFMARQELRIGVASNHANMAVNIAQMGANEVMANWNGYQLGLITPWDSSVINGAAPGGTWRVRVINANNYVYRINATGEVTQGGALWAGATRDIGIIARMLFADIDPPGALTTRGNVTVQGTASIDGGNQVPPGGWGPYCTTVPTDDGAGVVTDAGGTVETKGTGSVNGDPPTVQDPTIVDETFTNFGNLSWTDLTTLAQIEGKVISHISTLNNTFPQLDGGGACDEVPVDNWGDPQVPTNPCGAYFPLIYHGGNLTIQSNGYGQGILLIEGDLDLRGGYHFYGIIITQGAFATGAGGATVYGAVLAGNDLILDQTATGGAQIIYSRCAVRRAVLNNANLSRARPLATRSWVDLSAVTN